MREGSSHGARTRTRVAENLYSRRTKRGELVFEVAFRDVDGRQRRRRLEARTERAAIREARAILATRDGGERIVGAELTMDELAERDYFPMIRSLADAGRRSERNVDDEHDRYRLHVKPRLGEMLVGDVEPSDLAELIAAMRGRRPKPYAEATIDNVVGVVRALYRLARSRGYVTRSPVDGLDPAELPQPSRNGRGRVLDETELSALVRHAVEPYRAPVVLLAYSGLRLSEALGLRWRDVDLVAGELRVRGQLQPARGKREAKRVERLKSEAGDRIVPIFPAVERELVALLDERLGELRLDLSDDVDPRLVDDELVFRSRAGTPLNHRNVATRGVEAAARAAGLGKVTPKDLRASFCSLAGRRHVDPVEAAQLTGHSLAVWAKHYARSFGKEQRDEARDRMLEHGFGAAEVVPARSYETALSTDGRQQ